VAAPRDSDRNLPKTVKQMQLPSTEVLAEDDRAREIMRMQREIVRRRRRRIAQLIARLAFFVMLPTLITGYYYYRIATPMYESHTEFVIQQAQPQGAGAGLGGLFSGTSFATSQDSIAVQGYLQSREAMLRLDNDAGFIAHFQDPNIDPLQRLDPDATVEDAFKTFKRNVKMSYDPTEGIVKMHVVAADALI
jgi:capsular polysaccharide transport system permease protein